MPLPQLFRLLPRYMNPTLSRVAGRVPPLTLIHHQGRRTSRSYDTPVQAYPTPTGYIAAYAYSDQPHWARNLLAAGGGQMTRGGKRYIITNPRHLGEEGFTLLPTAVARVMRTIAVHDFLQFDAEPTTT